MKNYISAILLAIFAIPATGQSVSIFDIDTTNFPTMKAKFYAFDKDGKQQRPSASELQITENGINRTITNVSCPNIPPYTLSVGIMVDTYKYIDLARKGVARLVDFLNLPQDEIGITYMAGGVYIYQDFTKNKQKASASAALIPSAPGVDVNAMFYAPNTGGIAFIKDRKSDKKILILVSDLHCPNLNINEVQLIADAKANNISIYSVLLGSNDYTGLFNRIAKGSGGKVFEKVSDENQITNIFQEIERIERNDPCEIEWIGDVTCDTLSTVVELNWQNEKSTTTYLPKSSSIASLIVSPNFIAFGKKKPNSQNDTTITLTAQNSDFVVNNIKKNSGVSDFTIANITFPLIIPKNNSKNITLRYKPTDSVMKYSSFEVETDKCPAYFSASGVYTNDMKSNENQTIKLIYPNGKEIFNAGDDTLIKWTGVSPTDIVRLDYSINSGTNWNLISNKATNLKHTWKKIPLPVSNNCLIKVTQFNELDNYLKCIFTLNHKRILFELAFSPNGRSLATTGGDYSNANIWDITTGKEIISLNHNSGVSSVSYSPDGSKVVTSGGFREPSKIWDANTGALIRTFTGHTGWVNSVAYSPNGNQIATASDDSTAKIWDANTGNLIKTLESNYYGNYNAINKITFNNDGRMIATFSKRNISVMIWDVNTGKNISKFYSSCGIAFNNSGGLLASTNQNGSIDIRDINNNFNVIKQLIKNTNLEYVNSIAFSQDDRLIMTTSRIQEATGSKNIVRIWDINKGIIISEILGHTEEIVCGKFSPDGTKIATASFDSTAKIWDLEMPILQQDISDSLFSIIAPEANFNKLNIDLGKVVLGLNKDTLVTAVFCNTGAAPLHVMGVDVTNGNIADFMVPRGAGEFYLPPNECRDLMFDFMPTQLGTRNAKITVKSTIGDFVDTINITGEGIAPQLEIVNNLIDFGLVDVWQSKDTIQVVTIKNVGAAALNINNSLHLGPNDIDFTTLSGAAPFSLNAGETAKMNLRFSPKSIGRTSGRLQFEFNGAGSPATVQLFGTGLGGTATINIGSDSAYTEEQVEIPVNILANNKLLNSGVTAISFELEMNKTILFPIGVNSIIDGENRIIKFDSAPIKNVGLNEVAKLKFIATLGTAEETTIRVRNIIPIGNDADFDVIDGNFKLLGVCKEGGDRFLASSFSQTKLLSIAPNPATESIEIEYSNADDGEAEIIISNLLGQTILTQKLEKTQTGKTKLDLSQIPTGQYSILFKTETVMENKMIQVIN